MHQTNGRGKCHHAATDSKALQRIGQGKQAAEGQIPTEQSLISTGMDNLTQNDYGVESFETGIADAEVDFGDVEACAYGMEQLYTFVMQKLQVEGVGHSGRVPEIVGGGNGVLVLMCFAFAEECPAPEGNQLAGLTIYHTGQKLVGPFEEVLLQTARLRFSEKPACCALQSMV